MADISVIALSVDGCEPSSGSETTAGVRATIASARLYTLSRGTLYCENIAGQTNANSIREMISLQKAASIGFTSLCPCLFAAKTSVLLPITDAEEQTEAITERMSTEEIYRRTGHRLSANSPLIRLFADRGKHFFDTVTDYPSSFISMLTQTAVLDRTVVSAAGLLSLESLDYDRDIELELGLCSYNFPRIASPGEIVGYYDKTAVTAVCGSAVASAMINVPKDSVCVIPFERGNIVAVNLSAPPRTELCDTYDFSIEAGFDNSFNLYKKLSEGAGIEQAVGEIAGITGVHYGKIFHIKSLPDAVLTGNAITQLSALTDMSNTVFEVCFGNPPLQREAVSV